jgi:hypothetical protein
MGTISKALDQGKTAFVLRNAEVIPEPTFLELAADETEKGIYDN